MSVCMWNISKVGSPDYLVDLVECLELTKRLGRIAHQMLGRTAK